MTNTVLIKRSGVANSVPLAANLQAGELAINYNDGNLFYKNSGGTVTLLTSNQFVSVAGNVTGGNLNATGLSLSGNVVSTFNVTGNIAGNYIFGNGSQLSNLLTVSQYTTGNISNVVPNVHGLMFDTVTGFSVTDLGGGNALITLGSSFKTWEVTGQTSLVAVGEDTVRFVAGNNIVITTNALSTPQQIAFSLSSNVSVTGNVEGGNLITAGSIYGTELWSTNSVGGEGGQINLALPASGTTLNGGVVIDVYNNQLRFYERSGTNRGAYIDLTAASAGAGSNLLAGGSSSTPTQIVNGTSNVVVASSGNVTVGVAGTAAVATFTTAGVTANLFNATNISVSGNISGGNLLVADAITSSGTIYGTSTVTGGNLLTGGQASATGNVTGGNLITGGIVSSATIATTGNAVIGGNLTVNGNISYLNIDSLNIEDPIIGLGRGANGEPLVSDDGKDRGTDLWYYNSSEKQAFIGYKNSSGKVFAATDVSIANEIVTVNSYGTFVVGTLEGTAASTTGNITGGNINTGGLVSAAGNVSGNYILGNGALLTGVITSVANINFGTSNVTVVSSGGNVTVGVGGTGNVAVFATTGEYVTGVISATGNVTGGNVTTAGLISAAGNITGGNIIATADVSATGISSSGNIIGGNLNTAGQLISSKAGTTTTGSGQLYLNGATLNRIDFNQNGTGAPAFTARSSGTKIVLYPNISNTAADYALGVEAGAFWSGVPDTTNQFKWYAGTTQVAALGGGGNLSVTGNIIGDYFIGSGSALTNITGANVTGTVANATYATNATNAGTVTSNAQANITSVGTLTSLSSSGNITGGNLNAVGLSLSSNVVSALNVTANIAGGNITTDGLISATGNIMGGNILGGANVNATTHTGTTVSVSGNVTGGNVNTDVVSGTGTTIKSIGAINLSTTGNIVVNSAYINGVLTPVQDSDAATKAYVDNVAQGLHIHDSANLASTVDLATYTGATVTYSNGASGVGATLSLVGNTLTTLDGTTLVGAPASTRLLIKNQANAVQNGMYNYTSSSLLTRTTDFDTSSEAAGGDFLFVTTGATQADTGWVQTTDNPTIGTSNIVFTQFSGAGTYTANTSAGLVLNGTVFSAKVDNTTTAFDGSGNIIVKASANLTTPNIGVATGTSLSVIGNITGNYFIGNGSQLTGISAGTYATITVDNFTGNGSGTTYTLSVTPDSINQTTVNYNGVTLIRGDAYTLSGANIVLSSAAANASQIQVTTLTGVQINPTQYATTGKAIAMSIVFGG